MINDTLNQKIIIKSKNQQKQELINLSSRSRKINQKNEVNRFYKILNSISYSIYSIIVFRIFISKYLENNCFSKITINDYIDKIFKSSKFSSC